MSDNLNQKASSKSGDINQTINNYYLNNTRLTKTKIYDLLQLFYESSSNSEDVDIYSLPSEFTFKLKFNNVKKYTRIFEIYASSLGNLISVMEDLPIGEKVIQNLKAMYIKVLDIGYFKKDNTIVIQDGDSVIESLFNRVKENLKIDSRSTENKDITVEDVNEFSYAFLAYTILQCQILENPNKEKRWFLNICYY